MIKNALRVIVIVLVGSLAAYGAAIAPASAMNGSHSSGGGGGSGK